MIYYVYTTTPFYNILFYFILRLNTSYTLSSLNFILSLTHYILYTVYYIGMGVQSLLGSLVVPALIILVPLVLSDAYNIKYPLEVVLLIIIIIVSLVMIVILPHHR